MFSTLTHCALFTWVAFVFVSNCSCTQPDYEGQCEGSSDAKTEIKANGLPLRRFLGHL